MNKEQSKRRNEIYRIYNMFFGAKLRNSVMRISRDEIKIEVFLSVTPGVIRRFAKAHYVCTGLFRILAPARE